MKERKDEESEIPKVVEAELEIVASEWLMKKRRERGGKKKPNPLQKKWKQMPKQYRGNKQTRNTKDRVQRHLIPSFGQQQTLSTLLRMPSYPLPNTITHPEMSNERVCLELKTT